MVKVRSGESNLKLQWKAGRGERREGRLTKKGE